MLDGPQGLQFPRPWEGGRGWSSRPGPQASALVWGFAPPGDDGAEPITVTWFEVFGKEMLASQGFGRNGDSPLHDNFPV